MIIKNVLSNEKADELERILMSDNFPWYWNESTLYNDNKFRQDTKIYQFTHNFISDNKENSDWCYLIYPIVRQIEFNTNIKVKSINRVKANLLTKMHLTDEETDSEIHTDIDLDNYYSFVYYVSDSDGDTVLYSDDKVIERARPRKNTGLFFKSNMKHRGTSPSVNKRRVVINIVLETF